MSYLLVVLLIAILIFLHEAGHFLVARRVGIPIARFSLGFGPKLWGWRRGVTEYRLSAIPLGGYVLIDLADGHDYFRIPLAKRLAFALGGPLINLLLPIPIFMVLNALTSGMSFSGLLVAPFVQTAETALHIVGVLPAAFARPETLSGLVGVVSQGGQAVGLSPERALEFAALLSVNLGIFNLLPFPVLDGGKIVLDLAHRVNGRVVRYVEPITVCGLLVMVGLFLFVTVLDVYRIVA